MMLSSFLPKIEQRYVFVGSAVGAVLPASFFAIATSAGFHGSFLAWALQNPSQFTLAAMPAWMGLVALQFARNRRRQIKSEAARRHQERRLVRDALHDHLTGLRNRAAFQSAARRVVGEGHPYSLMLLDLDKFKAVNDTKGHQAGDALLATVGRRLATLEKEVPHAFVYRLGGDEFVILVRAAPEAQTLTDIAERVEQLICEPIPLTEGTVQIGVSIGIASADQPGEPLDGVMQRADLALYSAKDFPGAAHMFYDRILAEASLSRLQMERDLAHAVAAGEFVLEFQPILDALSAEVVAMEALPRWLHPQKGLLATDGFAPAAERCGMMRKIDAWVLSAACMEAVAWPKGVGVSVSISKDTFEDEGLPAYLVRCLDRSGLPPQRLTLQLSESVTALGMERVRERLAQIHALGIRVTLHDFGLALHTMNKVIEMDLDGLKLERSLTAGALSGERGLGVMEAFMDFGAAIKGAGRREANDEDVALAFIRHRDISQVQGYLSSKPIPASSVNAYIEQNRPSPLPRSA